MTDTARDQFARYFTEKLWDWIPAVYRNEDGKDAPNKHVLRAMIQALGEHAAIARRGIDRVWENQSIEACDDWAVALIGELVGTRLVPALNRRGRRVDVARTIHYRRRAGTLHVLNQLILDIAAWDGAIVESFRTLGRTHHALDPLPLPRARYTHTPRGGIADLRQPRGVELVDGPWDEFSHTADLRPNRGRDGLRSIRGLNFHLYRQRAYLVEYATPVKLDLLGEEWTFDPSGRDTPLFMPSYRPEQPCSARNEWDVAGPIRCRLLGHAEYVITDAVLAEVDDIDALALAELATMKGLRFRDETRLRTTLAAAANGGIFLLAANYYRILATALTDDSAKATLVRDARALMLAITDDSGQIPHERMVAGDLSNWNLSVYAGKTVAVDPVRGRFWFPGGAPEGIVAPKYHYGFTGDLGAGTYDRGRSLLPNTGATSSDGTFNAPVGNVVSTILDSATYTVTNFSFPLKLVLQAASLSRPYLRRSLSSEGVNWTITATGLDAELTLEGLWYGGGDLILTGNFKRVTIRHCTLDPGGMGAKESALLYANIVVTDAVIDELVIESSIVAGISLGAGGSVLALKMSDSIATAAPPGPQINLPGAELTLERCTLDVPVIGLRINATEILARQKIEVLDHQAGCVRYSLIAPLSHTPPPFPPLSITDIPTHWFTSRRFGDPGFYALSETASERARRGAENGSELGAFSNLIEPLKHDSLRTKVHEFMPLGRLPAFVRET